MNGGTIYQARRRLKWPGLAAVVVSVVHIMKGEIDSQKILDGQPTNNITAFLLRSGSHCDPAKLKSNTHRSFVGSFILGTGFTFDDANTKSAVTPLSVMRRLIQEDPRNEQVIFPFIGGQEVNSSATHAHHRYVINFGDRGEDECRALWPELMRIVEAKVKPRRLRTAERSKSSHGRRAAVWWQIYHQARKLYAAIADLDHVLVTGAAATKYHAFARISARQVFSHKLIVFPQSSYAAFGSLQASPHEIWRAAFGSTLKDDFTYTPSDVFETFPFPRQWTTDRTLEAVGQAYYEFRADLMVMNDEGLTKTYNRYHDPDERNPDIAELRILHAAMDRAVLDAYGWTDIPTDCEFFPQHEKDNDDGSSRRRKRYLYRWPDSVRDEVLGRLMDLNAERAEEERCVASKEKRKR